MAIELNNNQLNIDRLSDFFQQLRKTKYSVLMLDYDGTLAPFRKDRNQAIPYKGVRDILKKLLKLKKSRIIIISGRWTKDLIPLLGLDQPPEIWGSHGIERRKANGEYTLMDMPENALQGLAEADVWVDKNNLTKYSEEKPGCLALHWRGLTYREIKEIKNKVIPEWSLIANRKRLLLNEFDGGLELRVPGIDKGLAVKTILKESEKNSMAAYLGDDLTDEDAFKVIKGKGLGVLVRKKYRPTEAEVWIKPPQQLLKFLKNWYKILKE